MEKAVFLPDNYAVTAAMAKLSPLRRRAGLADIKDETPQHIHLYRINNVEELVLKILATYLSDLFLCYCMFVL